MLNTKHYAVIMAGGIGSRFWPVSTTEYPKQYHDMLGTGSSFLQTTFSRLNKLIPTENIFILTNERYLNITLQQLPEISSGQVVLEPAMRNTAPCILLAALKIRKMEPDALMIVAPSDHWIEDETAFAADVNKCFDACSKEDILMTLGITPTFPNTGFGYIEMEREATGSIKKVIQFREKPDYETAKQFLSEGNFLWNAGIFIWSVKAIIQSFHQLMPRMFDLFSEGKPAYNTEDEKAFLDTHYPEAENISIDYGILEKADNVYVKQASFDWNDLGTWGALYDKLPCDDNENTVVRAQTYLKDASGNMIYSNSDKLIVVDGIKDYIIVDNGDVLMLYPKKKEQDVKQLLQEIRKKYSNKYT